jgi:phosphate transport system protein
MSDKHLSSQFDNDLNAVCGKLLEMGGVVESQVATAMRAFANLDGDLADQVMAREVEVNDFEIEIDSMCTELIARRQPTARDLRLVMAISKAITNLERAGDEADRIARRTKHILEDSASHGINVAEIRLSGQMAVSLLRRSLDCFARLDTKTAVEVVYDDKEIDDEFRAFVRKLVSYMAEDPRTISVALDMLFIAKAVERIGDHAKNIAEFVIYIVKGTDVRHLPHDQLSQEINS